MRCGISTACFYPEDTLKSLRAVISTGAPVTEIFLNTFSELEEDYIAALEREVNASGIKVVSIHPFTSSMEGFFFMTMYEGRLEDGMRLYRRYFEICERLGAGRLVFHGSHKGDPASQDLGLYAKRFRALAALGQEYGVKLSHENVFYCRLFDPQQVEDLRPLMGEAAHFVLDTKQQRRAGAELTDMLAAMEGAIDHVHISGYTAERDCVPPGTGEEDMAGLIRALKAQGYMGDLVIELYRDGYEDAAQLTDAMRYVQGLIDTV